MVKSPDLRRIVKGLKDKEVLVPLIHTALNDPDFSGFTVQIEPWTARPPDGYFHPSTQGTWNLRQLTLYLLAPNLFDAERMELSSVFAITQGHFWHMFLQHILEETGVLLESEVGFTDEEHKRRGHIDGILEINGKREGLEIKTINPYKIDSLTSEATLKELKPEYWSQSQEYLDVFDLDVMRYLVLSPTYPFKMKEFVVKTDPTHQDQRRRLYKHAIELAQSESLPLTQGACCGNLTSCPVRYGCQYG